MSKVFKPFQKVLVAHHYDIFNDNLIEWQPDFYYRMNHNFHYTMNHNDIPDNEILSYEGNEHLLGKEVRDVSDN